MSSGGWSRSSGASVNHVLREPLAAVIQWLINLRRPNDGLALAEERILPDEEESLQSIITSFAGYMMRTYPPGRFERGGNTKTHGVVRAEVRIHDGLPDASAARHLRRAADLQGLCALLGPGTKPAGRHPRRRLRQHGDQAHGRSRAPS